MTGKYIVIFAISLMPILELRGGLIAASLMDVPIWQAFLVCIGANILIIPFVLFFVETLLAILSKIDFLRILIEKFKEKTLKKKDTIEKYGYLGIMLFVAVPVPGSGAWTGCLLAVLLGLDKKKSFLAALGGLFIAGVVMLIFSYGILKGIVG
ncbi:MAG TPA: small multi-drug export protein [Firmicutes bacterium]|nr:small multi-drug export protein [Bacillota bacterium]